jgi:hypothetical protein
VTVPFPPTETVQTARHEAAHAASLIVSNMTPAVCRVDEPIAGELAGLTKPDWETHDLSRENLIALLESVLAAPLMDGEPLDDIEFPPDLSGWSVHAERDAQQIDFLVRLLCLDRIDWIAVICHTRNRIRSYRFRALLAEISAALQRTEIVFQPQLQEIAARIGDRP